MKLQYAMRSKEGNRAFLRAQKTGTRGKPLQAGMSIKEIRGDIEPTRNSLFMFHMEQLNAFVGLLLTLVAVVFVVQYEYPEEAVSES